MLPCCLGRVVSDSSCYSPVGDYSSFTQTSAYGGYGNTIPATPHYLDFGLESANLDNSTSPPNPLYPSLGQGGGLFSSPGTNNFSLYGRRQRSATSGILPFNSSLHVPEDPFSTSNTYDVDLFESSTEPLFSKPTFETQLNDYPLGQTDLPRLPYSHVPSFELGENDPIEDFLPLPSLPRRTQRSMSDVEPLSFPDSLDYGLSSGVGSLLSRGSLSTTLPGGDSCKRNTIGFLTNS